LVACASPYTSECIYATHTRAYTRVVGVKPPLELDILPIQGVSQLLKQSGSF